MADQGAAAPTTEAPAPAPAPAPPVDNSEALLTDPLAFWQNIWENEPIPKFDVQCPSPCLLKLIAEGVVPPGRALVPGCGRGYDVTALASADREAIGLDLSPTGITAARARLAALPDAEAPARDRCEFKQANFFEYNDGKKFTVIYDYTFLCALPPLQRPAWAAKMKELLEPETGLAITLIYPLSSTKVGGPPFAMSFDLLKSLLEPLGFVAERLELLPPELCHPGRDGSGNWGATSGIGVWRLKAE